MGKRVFDRGLGKLGTITLTVLCIHELSLYHHLIYGNPFENLALLPVINLVIEAGFEIFFAVGSAYVYNYMQSFVRL